jgi:hypothetical protein
MAKVTAEAEAAVFASAWHFGMNLISGERERRSAAEKKGDEDEAQRHLEEASV